MLAEMWFNTTAPRILGAAKCFCFTKEVKITGCIHHSVRNSDMILCRSQQGTVTGVGHLTKKLEASVNR